MSEFANGYQHGIGEVHHFVGEMEKPVRGPIVLAIEKYFGLPPHDGGGRTRRKITDPIERALILAVDLAPLGERELLQACENGLKAYRARSASPSDTLEAARNTVPAEAQRPSVAGADGVLRAYLGTLKVGTAGYEAISNAIELLAAPRPSAAADEREARAALEKLLQTFARACGFGDDLDARVAASDAVLAAFDAARSHPVAPAADEIAISLTREEVQAVYLTLLHDRPRPAFGWMEAPLVSAQDKLKPIHSAIHDRQFNAMNRAFFGDERFTFPEAPLPVAPAATQDDVTCRMYLRELMLSINETTDIPRQRIEAINEFLRLGPQPHVAASSQLPAGQAVAWEAEDEARRRRMDRALGVIATPAEDDRPLGAPIHDY